MTSKSKTASAVIALASLVAGAGMLAFVIRVQATDRVWNETRNLTAGNPFEPPGPGMPYVPPVPPLGNVTIGPVTYDLAALPVVKPVAARPRLKQTCVPYWRELLSGPAGRQVAITCPGGPEPPPPPPSAGRVSRLQRLPSLEDLRTPVPRHAIMGDRPHAEEALQAARRVAESLGQQRVVSTEPTPSTEALVPASNPLDWRACSPEERTASNEPGLGGRC
jgi:hypothetical protein